MLIGNPGGMEARVYPRNSYTYGRNNPVTSVDSFGLQDDDLWNRVLEKAMGPQSLPNGPATDFPRSLSDEDAPGTGHDVRDFLDGPGKPASPATREPDSDWWREYLEDEVRRKGGFGPLLPPSVPPYPFPPPVRPEPIPKDYVTAVMTALEIKKHVLLLGKAKPGDRTPIPCPISEDYEGSDTVETVAETGIGYIDRLRKRRFSPPSWLREFIEKLSGTSPWIR